MDTTETLHLPVPHPPVFADHARPAATTRRPVDTAPIWLHPLIRLLVLDEHGAMPRAVQAQVGFGALLLAIQFCLDVLAWCIGLKWVFVPAIGPAGWLLVVAFAVLLASIIAIFERFVLTADLGRGPKGLFQPGIIVRVLVVVLFASVTSVPVELMVFHDVVQGRIDADRQAQREGARQVLRGDHQKSLAALEEEEAGARKRLQAEIPPVVEELPDLARFEAREQKLEDELEATRVRLREEELGYGATAGKGPRWNRANVKRQAVEEQLAKLRADRDVEVREKRESNRKAQEARAERFSAELVKLSTRFDARRQPLQDRLAGVDALGDDELQLATRRTFDVPDGFARRWKELQQLEEETPAFAWTKWAVRLLFISFGLLVLTTKALFSPSTRAYYARASILED